VEPGRVRPSLAAQRGARALGEHRPAAAATDDLEAAAEQEPAQRHQEADGQVEGGEAARDRVERAAEPPGAGVDAGLLADARQLDGADRPAIREHADEEPDAEAGDEEAERDARRARRAVAGRSRGALAALGPATRRGVRLAPHRRRGLLLA